MITMLVEYLGRQFGNNVLEPIGDLLRGLFEGILTFLFSLIGL